MMQISEISEIKEWLPILIPLAIVQFSLLGYSLYHILTHKYYKRGNRVIWVILSFVNFIGPILYFLLGKEES